ncbi:HEAT repeat domain-containing protein [Sporosarcina limicola]|uniref:HEAT repeat domain-containing protein n=1 Tax=Sporosarcina limicola TaxID=34101 RepID=UPI00178B522D|nr:HEAT repeat domain-containing protein [Sporosarcina limicola]
MNRLSNQEEKSKLPANYLELKKAANRMSNWRVRLDAVAELGQCKHKQTIDVLTHRMINDPVYKVQEAAYKSLKKFGEDVQMPEQNKFDLLKDASKVFLRIKKSLPRDHTFEEYREKLKNMRLDLYDTYEGDKGADFDKWLENKWQTMETKKGK